VPILFDQRRIHALQLDITFRVGSAGLSAYPAGPANRMSGKAAKRGRFFGRRQRKPIGAAERPQQEEQVPDPRMSSQTWKRNGCILQVSWTRPKNIHDESPLTKGKRPPRSFLGQGERYEEGAAHGKRLDCAVRSNEDCWQLLIYRSFKKAAIGSRRWMAVATDDLGASVQNAQPRRRERSGSRRGAGGWRWRCGRCGCSYRASRRNW
jgi:hypothetical protein